MDAPDRHQEAANAANAFDRAAMLLRCGCAASAMLPAREGMDLLRLCCEDEERCLDLVALARARCGGRVGGATP